MTRNLQDVIIATRKYWNLLRVIVCPRRETLSAASYLSPHYWLFSEAYRSETRYGKLYAILMFIMADKNLNALRIALNFNFSIK